MGSIWVQELWHQGWNNNTNELANQVHMKKDKGYMVHVLKIDHIDEVTKGLSTNGPLTVCL